MSYAEDLTGKLPANYLTITLNRPTSGVWLFKLPGGSFYTADLSVASTFDRKELEPLTQYRALQLEPEASRRSGKEVCDLIYIVDNNITQVTIKYHVIGGQFQVIGSDVDQLVLSAKLDNSTASSWGQIIDAPMQYPPEMHTHYDKDAYGMESLIYVNERIAKGITAGDGGLAGAFYQYIDRKFGKLEIDTQTKLDALEDAVDSVRDQGKMQPNQIVFFMDDSDPAVVFKYGRWERLPDGLVMMTANNALVGTKKKLGEGIDYLGVYYAAWKYLGD